MNADRGNSITQVNQVFRFFWASHNYLCSLVVSSTGPGTLSASSGQNQEKFSSFFAPFGSDYLIFNSPPPPPPRHRHRAPPPDPRRHCCLLILHVLRAAIVASSSLSPTACSSLSRCRPPPCQPLLPLLLLIIVLGVLLQLQAPALADRSDEHGGPRRGVLVVVVFLCGHPASLDRRRLPHVGGRR